MSTIETPIVQPRLVIEEETAPKWQRTRKYAKIAFARVGVPMLIGTATYFAVKTLNESAIDITVTPK